MFSRNLSPKGHSFKKENSVIKVCSVKLYVDRDCFDFGIKISDSLPQKRPEKKKTRPLFLIVYYVSTFCLIPASTTDNFERLSNDAACINFTHLCLL